MFETVAAIITVLFLLVVLSYYLLLLVPRPKRRKEKVFRSLTVIIPARNEARDISACIRSVLAAEFAGTKQVIVVDDASHDNTSGVAKLFPVKVLRNSKQLGKSASLNKALKVATGDLVAVVDGDSVISENALADLAKELGNKNVGAATGIIKVLNRKKFLNPWVHLELLNSSLIRSLMAKVNANVVTPGALSMYRRDALASVGNFRTDGFSEDMDIAVRLVRKGYHLSVIDSAVSSTVMPSTVKGFLRQRTRISRGLVHVFKRHLRFNTAIIDVYTMPLLLFSYLQALIMGVVSISQIVSGYFMYFADKDVYWSWDVAKFLFNWLTIIGFVQWMWGIVSGSSPLTFIAVAGIMSTLLTYPLFAIAILKYDKRVDFWHLWPFLFMFPYWIILMLIHISCVPEIFRRKQYNMWKKNE